MPNADTVLEELRELDPVSKERVMFELIAQFVGTSPAIFKEFVFGTPSVIKTPGVCGGSARLIRTRIPVWTLVRMLELGCEESEILRSYPALTASDLVQAWSYASFHKEEIDRDIKENEGD